MRRPETATAAEAGGCSATGVGEMELITVTPGVRPSRAAPAPPPPPSTTIHFRPHVALVPYKALAPFTASALSTIATDSLRSDELARSRLSTRLISSQHTHLPAVHTVSVT